MSSNSQEKSLYLSGQIGSHVQFENPDFVSIVDCVLPNPRCVKCAALACPGKAPKETKNGCADYKSRR